MLTAFNIKYFARIVNKNFQLIFNAS